MKKILNLFFILISSSIFSQINPDDTLNVEILEEVKSPSYLSLGANLFDLNLSGSHIYFGSGGSFDLVNFKNKFSIFSTYIYYYGNYKYNGGSNDPISNINPKKSNYLDLSIGYTFNQTDEVKEESLKVTKRGNTEYYVNVNARSINSQMFKLGYYSLGQINSGDNYKSIITDSSEVSVFDFSIFHQLNCFQVGYAETKSLRSSYNVLKYGKRFNFEERTRYIDLLIAMPFDLPVVSSTIQNELESQYFSKLPIGLRVGVKKTASSHMSKSMIFGTKIELGVNPGFYSGIRSMGTLFFFKMGLTVNLFKSLN